MKFALKSWIALVSTTDAPEVPSSLQLVVVDEKRHRVALWPMETYDLESIKMQKIKIDVGTRIHIDKVQLNEILNDDRSAFECGTKRTLTRMVRIHENKSRIKFVLQRYGPISLFEQLVECLETLHAEVCQISHANPQSEPIFMSQNTTKMMSRIQWGLVRFHTKIVFVKPEDNSHNFPREVCMLFAHRYFAMQGLQANKLAADDLNLSDIDDIAWEYYSIDTFTENSSVGDSAACRIIFEDKSSLTIMRPFELGVDSSHNYGDSTVASVQDADLWRHVMTLLC